MRFLIVFLTAVMPLALATQGVAQDSQSMRAIQIQEFGGPEVLELHQIARPQVAEGELLVRVWAAGINPVDTSIRAGRATSLSGAVLPYVPGFDVSGEVVTVGQGVSRFSPGDEIFAMLSLRRGGAYADYAIVKEDEAALKPEAISYSQAASVPLVALTAWQALFEVADLQPGQTVLIHAAAGGVGSIAVQLAKWRGATVIGTASEYNHDYLRQLGVDIPVDYRTQRFEDFVTEVDVVLDPIGGETQVRSMAILREGGTLVSIVGLTPEGSNPQRDINVSSILVHPDQEQLSRIGELIQQGIIEPIVTHRFELSQAAEAHQQSETRRTRGKIVLEMNETD